MRRLGKDTVAAHQASRLGGTLIGDRIAMAGKAVLYSTAELFIEGIFDVRRRTLTGTSGKPQKEAAASCECFVTVLGER